MKFTLKNLFLTLSILSISPAMAQWQVPVNNLPIGRGPGVIGFGAVGGTSCLFQTDGANVPKCLVSIPSGIASPLVVGTSVITSGTTTRVLFDNAGVLGEYSISGTGNVCMSVSCAMTTPVLGTPASGTLTNATGLPISTGVSGLGTGVAAFLATPSSANLRSALTDETGTGAAVFAGGPSFTGTVNSAGPIAVADTTASTTPGTGAETILGGLGVGGAVNIGGNLSTVSTTPFTAEADSGGAVLGPNSGPVISGYFGANRNAAIKFNMGGTNSGTMYFGTSLAGSFGTVMVLGAGPNAQTTFYGSALSQSPTGGIGYATGAGGTVTQPASKSTAISLSKVSGAITMNNAALAASAIVTFTWTNTAVAATDVIVTNHISGGTLGAYAINCRATGAGTAACDVRNGTAGSLSEAIVIQYAVIKAVNN